MSEQSHPFRGQGRGRGGRGQHRGGGGQRGGGGRGGYSRQQQEDGNSDAPYQEQEGLPPKNSFHTSSMNSLDGSGRGRTGNRGDGRGHNRGQGWGQPRPQNRGGGRMPGGPSDFPGPQPNEGNFQQNDGRYGKQGNRPNTGNLNEPNRGGNENLGNRNQSGNQRGRQDGNQRGRQDGNQRGRQDGNQRGRQDGNQRGRQDGNQRGRQDGNQRGRQDGNQRGRGGTRGGRDNFASADYGSGPIPSLFETGGPPYGYGNNQHCGPDWGDGLLPPPPHRPLPHRPPPPDWFMPGVGPRMMPRRPLGPDFMPRGGPRPHMPRAQGPRFGPRFPPPGGQFYPGPHPQGGSRADAAGNIPHGYPAPGPSAGCGCPGDRRNTQRGGYAAPNRPFEHGRPRSNRRGSGGRYNRGRSGYPKRPARKDATEDDQGADSDDSYTTNVSSIHPDDHTNDEENESSTNYPNHGGKQKYWRGPRGRQRYRGGRWSRYNKIFSKAALKKHDKDMEDDNESLVCETGSVRSSSPMSVVSDVSHSTDKSSSTKHQISSDDIKNVATLTLNNRVKRYQKKVLALKADNLDDDKKEELEHIEQVVAEIKQELKLRHSLVKDKEKQKVNEDSKKQTEESTDSDSDETLPEAKPLRPGIKTRKRQAKVIAKKGAVMLRPTTKTKTNQTKEPKKKLLSNEENEHVKSPDPPETMKEKEKHSSEPGSVGSEAAGSDKNGKKKTRTRNKKKTVAKEETIAGEEREEEEEEDTVVNEIGKLLGDLDKMFTKGKKAESHDLCDKESANDETGNKKSANAPNSGLRDESSTKSKKTNNKEHPGKSANQTRQRNDSVNSTGDDGKNKTRDRKDSGRQLNEPNVNEVFKFMVKEMEGKGTPELVSSNSGLFPQQYGKDNLQKWFENNSSRFTLIKRDGKLTYVLVLKKDCKVCLDYPTGKGCNKSEPCRFYHICRNFLYGHCRFGTNNCRFSHDLLDDYNMRLSKELGYNKVFMTKEILSVLRARYPHVCPLWTKGDCSGLDCSKLHICQRYLLDDCLEGDQCMHCHDRFTDHNKPIVDAYVMGHWNDRLFRKMVIVEKECEVPVHVHQPNVRPNVPASSRANRVFVNIPDSKAIAGKLITEIFEEQPNEQMSVDEPVYTRPERRQETRSEPVRVQNDEVRRDAGRQTAHTRQRNTNIATEATQDDIVICDLDLAGMCDGGGVCGLYHNRSTGLPYIWQVHLFGSWINLAQDEDVERAFSERRNHSDSLLVAVADSLPNVVVTFSGADPIYASVRFDQGEIEQEIEARRLSTKSYTEMDGMNDSYATQWHWYWQDDFGQWKLFDEDTMQYTLETKYLAGQTEYLFTRENYRFKYVIDFQAMTQFNVDTYKLRQIIRRPLLVTSNDVRHSRMAPRLRAFPPIEVALPKGWVPWDHTNDFELVKLSPTAPAYLDTVAKFFRTLHKVEIEVDSVFRVQSHSQWDAFCRKERAMRTTIERTRPGAILDKRDLFHGTDSLDSVRGICTHNFDQRVSGKNATVYGDGAYFARDAKYSHSYTKGPERFVFLAHTLVGQYTQGKSEYRRPPVLPGSMLELYDSCVDNMNNPTIFILFDKSQHYPAYLIQYRLRYPSQADTSYPSSSGTTGASGYSSGSQSRSYPSAGQTSYPAHSTSTQSSPTGGSPTKKKDTCSIQ